MQYKIGDFSRITRISVKTLRYYDQEGIIRPAETDPWTGYRLYSEENIERARIVKELRSLNFSIKEIKDILGHCSSDKELITYLTDKQREIEEKIRSFRDIEERLLVIIQNEQEIQTMKTDQDIHIKQIPEIIIASIRYTGCYGDVGKYFGTLYQKAGSAAAGPPFCLYYDDDYKEGDADIEACIPLKRPIQKDGLSVRTLPPVTAATLIHKGPYEELGNSYRRILNFMTELKNEPLTPSREIYVKGPGMIFRGNPKKYITELQLPYKEV